MHPSAVQGKMFSGGEENAMFNYLLLCLCGRHIYFRYNATSGDIADNTIEQLDLENICIAVGILSAGVLELEITLV